MQFATILTTTINSVPKTLSGLPQFQKPVQSINHIHQFGEKVAKFNRHRLAEGKMNGKSPNQGSASKFTGREIKRL